MSLEDTGDYNLSLVNLSCPGTPISCGDLLSGSISTVADIDVYEFAGHEGDQVVIDVRRTSGSTLRPALALHGPDGELVTYADWHIRTEVSQSGTYKIRVYDGDSGSGDMSLEDTGDYEITFSSSGCKPDLTFKSLSVAPNPVMQLNQFQVNWTIENQGNADATPVGYLVDIRLSSDTIYDDTDTLICSTQINDTLSSGQEISGSCLGSSADYLAGTYYIVAKVDTTDVVDESSETNNTASLAFEITPPAQCALHVHPGPGGSTDPEGTVPGDCGEIVPLVATPDPHYDFVNWTGPVADSTSPITTVTVNEDTTVIANFAIDQHNLTTDSSEGGSVTTPGEETKPYDHGQIVPLVATPDPHYDFVNWTGPVADSTSPSTTVTVNEDTTVMANFAPDEHELTTTSSDGGSVTTPGEETRAYEHGEIVPLVATPDPNYDFVSWTGDVNGVADTSNPMTTITMNGQNVTITANFEKPVRPLSVVTYPAKDICQASATLVGYITSDGGDPNCEYCFRWWPEGESEPEPGDESRQTEWEAKQTHNGRATFEGDLPEDGKPRLEPGRTYNYRAIAGNAVGDDWGGVLQFTTLTPLYVDDDAPNDPGPYNISISDPNEDGSRAHPFDSIQEAIEAAHQRDHTVFVAEGVYYETINLMGKNIDVNGFDPDIPGITPYPVIDANDTGTVVSFDHGEDPNCVLSGFVLTRGYGHLAGAIACVDSSPTLRNCLIAGNRCLDPNFDDPNGGVVYCVDSNSIFENCTIADNYGGENGVGLCCVDCNVIMANSIVWGNLPEEVLVESGNDPIIVYSDIEGGWPEIGNMDEDPNFVQPGYWANPTGADLVATEPYDPDAIWIDGDYHLMSEAGRWDIVNLDWSVDEITSPFIDAGDPESNWYKEPLPHGDRINMGAYGGTHQASMSIEP